MTDRKQVILLNEDQFEKILVQITNEQAEIDEYGIKGMKHDDTYLWTEGDQMLAMYNAEYGIEELGISKEEAVNEIIGTSIGSLAKQTSNFNYLAGRGGLDRPNKMQEYVYSKFKGIPRETFKKVCLDFIEDRLENPSKRVLKRKLGNEIGNKREEAKSERYNKLKKLGYDPDKMTMINQRPKFEPEDNEPSEMNTNSSKDEIRDYLNKIYDKLVETNPELADDIKFISDYIDNELVDKNMVSEIRKIFKTSLDENSKKKLIIKESDIKKISNIVKEQTKNEKKVIKLKESDVKDMFKKVLKENKK